MKNKRDLIKGLNTLRAELKKIDKRRLELMQQIVDLKTEIRAVVNEAP